MSIKTKQCIYKTYTYIEHQNIFFVLFYFVRRNLFDLLIVTKSIMLLKKLLNFCLK